MSHKKIANFGSWQSPITADLIVSGTIGLGESVFDGEDIYWLEKRPTEAGRSVLVKATADGKITDVTPPPYNVRNRVHAYGGGSFLVHQGTVYFTNFTDQRIYKQTSNQAPQALTEVSQKRYADFILDTSRNRLICVCEDHSNNEHEPENTLVGIDLNSGTITTLVSGDDFYTCPRLSHDGTKLAWLSWDHPYMPWDSTQLWLANIKSDGTLEQKSIIAGTESESICQPEWSTDGKLYFSSDRTGWWNLHRYNLDNSIESLWEMEAEFGFPHWVFGESIYGFISESELICTYTQNGSWYLASLDLNQKQLTPIQTNFTSISYLKVQGKQAIFLGASPTESSGIVKLNLDSKETEILKKSSNLEIDPGYLSIPQAISFPTDNNLTAYAWYYPPQNQDYTAPENSLPPLVVKSHGGPTAATSATLNLRIQYWTSRGFAFVDVNYGGSTGYGRNYRQRLVQNWGIVDVNDCVNVAQFLVKQGKLNPEKLAIAGGSAGGYTTLAALTFHNTFKAGASYYGISDLEALATDTHKFESRYLDNLIGKYPQEKAIYQQRSPIHFTDQLSCPVIFFQGLEDKVVPPNQAEMMVEALKNKGLPVAYVPFAGEQHGFRQAENIKKALESEYYFYARIFGFEPATKIEPVIIMNLD